MIFDFEFVLAAASLVTGIIWLIDHRRARPKREAAVEALKMQQLPEAAFNEAAEKLRREPVLVEYARSFFPVLLIVLLLRGFLVEPFRIPSGSMMPTLLAGDFILVNKFTYGIRIPVLKAKVVEMNTPQRGDVIVFRYPEDPSLDYIKRVVGVPGDLIGYYNKTIYINGKPLQQVDDGAYTGYGAGVDMSGKLVRQEQQGPLQHQILIDPDKPSQEGQVRVPEGHYFVMGDNRDNSNDSRYWGMVPEKNLVGKAFMIWMNWDSQAGGIAWQRLGTIIK